MSDIMVAGHASVSDQLFKKYNNDVSLKDQLKNYRRRVEGAEKLRAFIATERLTQIVAPRKRLQELPPSFAHKGMTSYVLVVDRLELLSSSESKQLYRQIDNETLRQLCTVLRTFRGLDSGARNVPFTRSGQIAFVDTERWEDDRDVPLRRIRGYLSDEQRRFAEEFFR